MTHLHDHPHAEIPIAPIERRVAALEELLTESGLIPEGFIEETIRHYEEDMGPMNGARVVAHAWVDRDYRARLLRDGAAAITELGLGAGMESPIAVVENTETVHNVIVCTLCSCYPTPLLGLAPSWYKDVAYRARIVREPRKVLEEMGCTIPANVEIKVWDSSSELRYLVLPQRPVATASLSEEELAKLVTRDAMVGTERL